MANLLVMFDTDADRRQRVCALVRPSIAPFPGLCHQEMHADGLALLWAAGPRAPIDCEESEHGVAAIWGRALPVGQSRAVTARDVAARWEGLPHTIPAPWDGYFAALAYDRDRGLTVGGDILGYFPLYWWSSGGVTLVGSSPELFRHHPSFRAELNPTGLAGVLLVMQSVGGQTLLKHVRRLAYGHLLHVDRDGQAMELEQYSMPCTDTGYDWSFTEHLEVIDDALDQCVGRHMAPGPNGMLLSGGLDSRLLSGFVSRHRRSIAALTFGVGSDFEAQWAKKVATYLHFDHRVADVDLDPALDCADLHARWFHLTSGFNSIEYWNAIPILEGLPPYFLAGYALDAAMSPFYGGRAHAPEAHSTAWDSYSREILGWGLGVDRLRRLLRAEVFGEAVDENLEALRSTFDGGSDIHSKCPWMFELLHRGRFHAAQMPWMFSFASWPLLPVLDQRFLEVLGGIPPATLGARRAELELVSSRFPELARIPLDRNSYNRLPIVPAWHDLLKQRIEYCVRPLLARLPLPRHERRYYHRVYSLESPGWHAIREYTAPHLQRLEGLFHREVLAEYLPAPDVRIATTDIFAESSGRKLLMGLSLWARDYLGDGAISSPHARSTVRCTARS